MEVPRDEDSEDDSDDDENKNGDSASTEGIIAKAKEEAKKNGDEEETKVSNKTLGIKNWKKVMYAIVQVKYKSNSLNCSTKIKNCCVNTRNYQLLAVALLGD